MWIHCKRIYAPCLELLKDVKHCNEVLNEKKKTFWKTKNGIVGSWNRFLIMLIGTNIREMISVLSDLMGIEFNGYILVRTLNTKCNDITFVRSTIITRQMDTGKLRRRWLHWGILQSALSTGSGTGTVRKGEYWNC